MIDYQNAFRDNTYTNLILQQIHAIHLTHDINLMEVCGGHTITIHQYGIPELLPPHIHLVSGPGCPVCVTTNAFIDKALVIANEPQVIICTFGDMLRVPGSYSSLAAEKAQGRDIRICLSSLDALKIATDNPDKQVVFLGIGFETTAPTIAASIKIAAEQGLTNYFVLSAMKTMPQALAALTQSAEFNVQGFICPGHVSTITGTRIYTELARNYPCVIAGFEPLDILQSIAMLATQIAEGNAEISIQYTRSVSAEGNTVAQQLMDTYLEPVDTAWRGLGIIPGSGLKIRSAYAAFDADIQFPLTLPPEKETPGCLCGAIMRGVKNPPECSLFEAVCTPLNPKGACMVSNEGTCATYYKYRRRAL